MKKNDIVAKPEEETNEDEEDKIKQIDLNEC